MNAVTARIMIEAFAVNAEIEGMKAANQACILVSAPLCYLRGDFDEKANALSHLANSLYDAWQQGTAL